MTTYKDSDIHLYAMIPICKLPSLTSYQTYHHNQLGSPLSLSHSIQILDISLVDVGVPFSAAGMIPPIKFLG